MNLGRLLDAGKGMAADPRRAAEFYERACDAEVLEACNSLGRLYEQGRGVEVDEFAAARLYMRAARSDPRGMYNLGRFYERGRGPIPEKVERAAELYERACEANLPEACFSLAARLARGGEALTDPVRAQALFERSCQLGQREGCERVGRGASSAP